MNKTYEIIEEGTGIVCLICGMPSYNREDVRRRYCGKCNVFHEDAPPQEQEGAPEPSEAPKKDKAVLAPARVISAKLGARKGLRMHQTGQHFTRRRLH